jgi:hypothetical protein
MDKTCATEECQCSYARCTEGIHAQRRQPFSARILRLFGVDRSLEESLSSIQGINNTWEAPLNYQLFLETNHSMLEAERKKAEGLQASWKYHPI